MYRLNSPSTCLVALQFIDAIFINITTLNTKTSSQHLFRPIPLAEESSLLLLQESFIRWFCILFINRADCAIWRSLLVFDWVLDLSLCGADLLFGWLWSTAHTVCIKSIFWFLPRIFVCLYNLTEDFQRQVAKHLKSK